MRRLRRGNPRFVGRVTVVVRRVDDVAGRRARSEHGRQGVAAERAEPADARRCSAPPSTAFGVTEPDASVAASLLQPPAHQRGPFVLSSSTRFASAAAPHGTEPPAGRSRCRRYLVGSPSVNGLIVGGPVEPHLPGSPNRTPAAPRSPCLSYPRRPGSWTLPGVNMLNTRPPPTGADVHRTSWASPSSRDRLGSDPRHCDLGACVPDPRVH